MNYYELQRTSERRANSAKSLRSPVLIGKKIKNGKYINKKIFTQHQ